MPSAWPVLTAAVCWAEGEGEGEEIAGRRLARVLAWGIPPPLLAKVGKLLQCVQTRQLQRRVIALVLTGSGYSKLCCNPFLVAREEGVCRAQYNWLGMSDVRVLISSSHSLLKGNYADVEGKCCWTIARHWTELWGLNWAFIRLQRKVPSIPWLPGKIYTLNASNIEISNLHQHVPDGAAIELQFEWAPLRSSRCLRFFSSVSSLAFCQASATISSFVLKEALPFPPPRSCVCTLRQEL